MALPAGLSKLPQSLTDSWQRLKVPVIVVVALLVLAAGAKFGYERYANWSEQKRAEETKEIGERFANEFGVAIKRKLNELRQFIDSTALLPLFASSDKAALAAKAAELAAQHPMVLNAWLLMPGAREVDYGKNPPLGYAAIEMVERSESGAKSTPPAVLLAKEKERRHVALLSRVEGADGSLAGHVFLALDTAFLRDAAKAATLTDGFAEVYQFGDGGRVVIAQRGDSGLRQGAQTLSTKLAGTPWSVSYWSRDALAGEGLGIDLPLLPLGGTLLLVGALVVVMLRRRRAATAPAVEAEIATAAPASDEAAAIEVAAPAPTAEDARDAGDTLTEDELEAAAPADTGALEVPASIFRAYDIRGIVGETLTVDTVRAIGQAIGSEAYARGQQTVVVGRDGRLSGPELLGALTEGLCASGRDVIDIGQVPTPVLYFATFYLGTGSGVMLTGSHNPANYNGLKIMIGEETLFGDDITALRTRIETDDLEHGEGEVQHMDVSSDYIRRVSEDIPVALGNPYTVVVDCGNGVAGDMAPKLLRALGHDVIELYCEVDGNFPNHHPDPSQLENLQDLIAAVKEHEADLGFAFDGDGDRLGVVDSNGSNIFPDRQMILYAQDVLSRNPGAEIVYDVKCSSRLGTAIAELGGKPVMWRTGHSFIKTKMRESGALLAGEMSGHIFFKERWYGFDDALYTAARLLEILMGFEQSPSEVFDGLPDGVSTPELRIELEEGRHAEFMSQLMQGGQFADDATITTIDGLRVDYPDAWGLVRPSNTTPYLVLRFEADNDEALDRIKEQFRAALLAVDSALTLPF